MKFNRSTIRPIRCAIALLAMTASLLLTGACQPAGVVASMAADIVPQKPVFAPAVVPTIVFCDSSRGQLGAIDADRLARLITERLDEKTEIPMIASSEIYALRDSPIRDFKKMSVADIGKAVGAKQVIHVELDHVGSGTAIGNEFNRSGGSALVRVIDVDAGTIVFPDDGTDGRVVSYQSKSERAGADPAVLRQQAMVQLARRIAMIFHETRASDRE